MYNVTLFEAQHVIVICLIVTGVAFTSFFFFFFVKTRLSFLKG